MPIRLTVISNAIKYNKKDGSIHIILREEKKQMETTLVESAVKDMESAAGTKEQRSTWARLIKIHLLINTIGIRQSRKGIWC